MKEHFKNPHITLIPLCQPATTSVWILSHFNRVLESNPDVVLVDYAVNDALYAEHQDAQLQYWTMMRAANERLVRRFLEYVPPHHAISKAAAPALMYVVLQRSWENASYTFSREVYEPVCRHYNIPLVSVRDVLWPDVNVVRNPSVWQTINGAHPNWKGHQLITDVLSFVWTVAEATASSTAEVPHESKQVQRHKLGSPFQFPSVGVSALDACPGGKYLSPPIGSAERLQPSRVGSGWAWVDHNGKTGWQYDKPSVEKQPHPNQPPAPTHPLSQRRETMIYPQANPEPQHRRLRNTRRKNNVLLSYVKSGQAANIEPRLPGNSTSEPGALVAAIIPQPPKYEAKEPLPGIISFPLRFDIRNPGLLVEYIKSYSNFGEAVFWATRGRGDSNLNSTTDSNPGVLPPHLKSTAEAMLSLAWSNRQFTGVCKRESQSEKNGLHRRVNGSPDCSLIMAGSWTDPSILEGSTLP
jgi:hypothetical protein